MELEKRIEDFRLRLLRAEIAAQRQPGTVKLLAVTKTQGIDKIKRAYDAGLSAFGENYLQEAQDKINALSSLPIEWHFIGPVQGNKAKKIAKLFAWVHSVDRAIVAEQLSLHRPDHLPTLNICIQVNVDAQKNAGIAPEQLPELANYIITLPQIKLRGLMMISALKINYDEQFQTFLKVHAMLDKLNDEMGLNLDTLSMGMSDDMDAAVQAGSTMVRIGRALFGERA
jgi:pyridoxal phosphate enzyme (YggS family)